jgi:cell division transport system ATP-binding protein
MTLEFKNITKKFGSILALNDIDFKVKPGEFVFIVGPSGSGKSTLIKLILNQIKPTSGSILIDEVNINKSKSSQIESIRQKIGVIFQDYQLIQDKTIEENIIVALDIISFPKDDVSARVDQVLKNVGLLSRRHLFPAQLSGGELQRASLARALSIDPKIILADEPTGNLDPENTWNLMKLLKQINHKLGVTVIMTTHNYEIIEAMNKRTITIKSGNLVEDKSPLISKKLQTKKS